MRKKAKFMQGQNRDWGYSNAQLKAYLESNLIKY